MREAATDAALQAASRLLPARDAASPHTREVAGSNPAAPTGGIPLLERNPGRISGEGGELPGARWSNLGAPAPLRRAQAGVAECREVCDHENQRGRHPQLPGVTFVAARNRISQSLFAPGRREREHRHSLRPLRDEAPSCQAVETACARVAAFATGRVARPGSAASKCAPLTGPSAALRRYGRGVSLSIRASAVCPATAFKLASDSSLQRRK
jgi:hypothetical protein